MTEKRYTIAVIGLGYVGLPLAIELSKQHDVIGYDIDEMRIAELRRGEDRTGLYDDDLLTSSSVQYTDQANDITHASRYIIAVPSPIHRDGAPNLVYLDDALNTIGRLLNPGDLVTLESTVYPGFTEEYAVPRLEAVSSLIAGTTFHVAYSPERINPGDASHIITNTVKLVGGLTDTCRSMAAELYAPIVKAGLHLTSNMRIAEAAKSLENVQRDVNIALINECALIYHRLGIDTHEVLAAAGTKWNFNHYQPGLVGGHCIGVDSSYLAYRAQLAGYQPEVILSGRRVNDSISQHLAQITLEALHTQGVAPDQSRILIMGVTFKENVRDIRNSKVFDLISHLHDAGIHTDVMDPMALPSEVSEHYGVELLTKPTPAYHVVIVAVKHTTYVGLDENAFKGLLYPEGHVIDVKSMYDELGEINVSRL